MSNEKIPFIYNNLVYLVFPIGIPKNLSFVYVIYFCKKGFNFLKKSYFEMKILIKTFPKW